MKRIGLLVRHPAPYRDVAIEKLAENNKETDITILCIKEVPENHTEWQYKPNIKFLLLGKTIVLKVLGEYCPRITSVLHKERYDLLIICGYYPLTMLLAIAYAWRTHTPYIFSCDTVKNGGFPKKFQKKIYDKAGAFWVPGNKTAEFLEGFGVPREKIFQGCYLNDLEPIVKAQAACDRSALRADHHISENEKVFLFVGNLIRSRNIELLLDAVKILEKQYTFKTIIIGGDGEDIELVEKASKESDSLIYLGKVNYNQLHSYYAIADAYVHPGAEPYSLAFLEAAVSGLFLISSDKVGAAKDFLVDDKTGKMVWENSLDELVEAMKLVLNDQYDVNELKKMRENILENRNNQWAAEQLEKAIEYSEKKK